MALADTELTADARKAFRFTVNNETFKSPDQLIEPSEILNISDHRPADEHILIQVVDRRTIAPDVEGKVNLGEKGEEVFFATRGDRTFNFRVDGRGFVWGKKSIEEPVLRAICELKPEQVFKLARDDKPDEFINDGSKIHFGDHGTEHLRIVKRPSVTVTVNGKAVMLLRGWLTGLQIKEAAITQGVQIKLDFTLDEEPAGGGDTQIIGDNDRTFIEGGERFGAVDHHEDS